MSRITIIITSLLILSACGKDDDKPEPQLPKYVFCTQETAYKLCEVRTTAQASIFDNYTQTVIIGSIHEMNEQLARSNSQARLRQ